MSTFKPKKVVLAYSGGLINSTRKTVIILRQHCEKRYLY
jgi:argininosuccinate synthase